MGYCCEFMDHKSEMSTILVSSGCNALQYQALPILIYPCIKPFSRTTHIPHPPLASPHNSSSTSHLACVGAQLRAYRGVKGAVTGLSCVPDGRGDCTLYSTSLDRFLYAHHTLAKQPLFRVSRYSRYIPLFALLFLDVLFVT